MVLLKRYLRSELETLLTNDIRFRVIGRMEDLAPDIQHELRLDWPLIGRFAADQVIGPQFIEPIARRTLRTIKAIAERDA